MTETRTVNGQEVIATERVPSNLSKRKDRPPVYFTSVEKLLLADESVTFGCTLCDYTAEKPGQVRFHHSTVHRGKKMGNPGKNGHATAPERIAKFDPAVTRVGPVTPGDEIAMHGFEEVGEDDILAALEAALTGDGDSEKVASLENKVAELEVEIDKLRREAENLTAERDWWKDAAQKSTERLVRLRNALQGVLRGEK